MADFQSSWRNGLAFLAIIHALRPDLVDMDRAKGRTNKENLKEAFKIAEHELNIPRLLEPEGKWSVLHTLGIRSDADTVKPVSVHNKGYVYTAKKTMAASSKAWVYGLRLRAHAMG